MVEYSEEYNCLFGKVIGMNENIISYEGKTVEELKADIECGVDLYLESILSQKQKGTQSNTKN